MKPLTPVHRNAWFHSGTGQNRRHSLLGLLGAVLLLPAAICSAAPFTNGNFEAATNADNLTTTFPSWTETAGNVAIKAPTALTGGDSTSALMTGTSGTTGTMTQSIDLFSGTFVFTLDFAVVDPGAAGTGNRSLQLLLTGSNGAQINLIVTRGSSTSLGSVQLYNGSAFQVLSTQADKVNFSTSLSSPVVNTLSLSGTIGGAYTLTTNGTSAAPVSFYQAGSAATPANIAQVSFTTVNATTVNYVVDNVTLIPEPTSACLLAAGGVFGLIRVRRRSR